MAEWAVRENKKDCEACQRLSDPSKFARGMKVRMVMDCENCEVTLHSPIPANMNVVEIYNSLPANFDGMSGRRIVSVQDIRFLFDVFEVDEELKTTYYHKVLFLLNTITHLNDVKREAEEAKRKKDQDWKKDQKSGKRDVMDTKQK